MDAGLSAQLVGLERRTARSGRDSIDHSPGGHDDLVNAAAGVLVGLDLDRRPVLVRAEALTVKGEAVPFPENPDVLAAVLAVGEDGTAACVYGAQCRHHGRPLTLLDFDVSPVDGQTVKRIAARMNELADGFEARGPRWKVISRVFLTPPAMVSQAIKAGLAAHAMPEELQDVSALALKVAGLIADDAVKISDLVAEKAKVSPWGGALAFRVGDLADNPLRTAAMQLVAGVLWIE